MLNPDTRISIADLAAVGITLRPMDAVAIVRELVLQIIRGVIPGVPSLHVIRMAPSGALLVEGPVAAGSRSIYRAAQLLETLLPPFDAAAEVRVPGALRLALARAVGTLDLPPYPSLDSFVETLHRFSPVDTPKAMRDLVSRWAEAAELAAELPSHQPSSPGVAASKTETTERQPAALKPAVAPEPIAAVEEPAPALRLGLEDFPAEDESERAAPRTFVAEPEPVTALEVVVAEHALIWEPEITRTRELVRLSRPRRRGGVRIAGWLGAAAVLGLAMTPLVQDRLWRDREQQLTAIRSTVDRISSAIPPIRRTVLPLEPAPTVPAAERPERSSDAPEAEETPAVPRPEPAPVRTPIDDAVAQSPSFATTGSAAFYRNPDDADGALIPAGDRRDGSVLRITRVVDDHAKNYHARRSPDGQQIAFDSDRDGERGIYVANVDGTNVKRVSGPGYGAIPSWSPDGTGLAFVRAEQEQPRVWNLWTVDLATGDLHRLTLRKAGQPWGASWFPDGNRIAYSVDDQLVIHDLDTGRERTFASPRRGQMVRTPAVSPDGRRVIFQIFRDGAWLLDLRDGSMRKVLADPTAEEYSWSPDGRRVAYHSRRSGQWGVWLMASR